MLGKLASQVSITWGLVAGAVAAGALTATVVPTGTSMEKMPVASEIPVPPAGLCTPSDEMVRAVAVIRFFDNEHALINAEEGPIAIASELLALPMPCVSSDRAYPALAPHVRLSMQYLANAGAHESAARLEQVARAYGAWDPPRRRMRCGGR